MAQFFRRWAQLLRATDDWLEAVGFPLRFQDVRTLTRSISLLAQAGWWGTLAAVLSIATLLGFTVLVPLEPTIQQQWLSWPGTTLFLAFLYAFCFAVLGSSIRPLPAAARLVVAAYLIWYMLLGPFLTLPRWLALLPVWILYIVELQRRPQWYWVVGWSLLLGRLSWQLTSPVELSIAAWAAFYTAIGLLVSRVSLLERIDGRIVLFAALGTVYAIAGLEDVATLSETVRAGIDAIGDFVGVFWIWLAVDLIEDATRAAYHVARRLQRWFARRWHLVLVGSTITSAALAAIIASIAFPAGLAWREGMLLCGGLLALVGGATLWRSRVGSDLADIGHDAVIATIVVGLVYMAGAALWESSQTTQSLVGWQVLLAAAPLVFEELKATAGGIQHQSHRLVVAALGVLGLAATAVQFANRSTVAMEATITAPLVGLLHIGLPYLAGRIVLGWNVAIEPARLFLIGYGAAYPAVLLGPAIGTGSAALAVLLWHILLRRSEIVSTSPRERIAALAIVAGGTLSFYFIPLVVPIPFLPWAPAILERLNAASAPPLLSTGHVVIWGTLLAAAVILGRWYRTPLAWVGAAALVALVCRLVG
ncbi:MAG: hypothetical protein KatS3mg040_0059 [Candidatus Kapaibacterium sp.]|nr:MAG: hypothetical protein KatS3mg040_0059 [Candidatus Kapabacteria bacterium]